MLIWGSFQKNSQGVSVWHGHCCWTVAVVVAVGRAFEGCSGVQWGEIQGEPLKPPPGASRSDGVDVRAGVRSQLSSPVCNRTALSKGVKKFDFNVSLPDPPQLLFHLFHCSVLISASAASIGFSSSSLPLAF